MSYFFDYIPDQYVGVEKSVDYFEEYSLAYVRVKNFFRTAKIRADMKKYVTLFTPYIIDPGERPDNVAQKLYRDPRLDWVICIANDIIDPYMQWPKDPGEELKNYVDELYGPGNDTLVHHYETREFIDEQGDVILKGGLVVRENATFTNWKTGEVIINAVVPITNYEYEEFNNEKKRFIYMLSPMLVDDFITEFENITAYLRNSEQDEYDVPKTTLRPLSRFLQVNSGVSISPIFGKYKNFIAAAQSTKAYLEPEEETSNTTTTRTYSGTYTISAGTSTVSGSFNPTQSDSGSSGTVGLGY